MSDYWWLVVDFIRDPRFSLPRVPFVLSILAFLAWAASRYRRPLTRRHVDRFADRQCLAVTPENGILIARALSISLQWRRFGLAWGVVIGVITGMLETLPHGIINLHFNYAMVFLGWFAGALVGEWRIASRPVATGVRRFAGLNTRSVASYVTRSNRVALGAALVILAAAVSYGAFIEPFLAGRGVSWRLLALLMLTTALLWATFRRVTQRAQPFIDDATRQADDALRGHALTVLAGCVIAAAGWLMFIILSGTEFDKFPFMVPGAVVGWWVAARSRSVRARSTERRVVVREAPGT